MNQIGNMARLVAFCDWPETAENGGPALSVVTPMLNEAGGAALLVREIASALSEIDHEIIIVDDGSTDDTVAVLTPLKKANRRLRVVRHAQNAGQSRAIRTGVLKARAPIVVMLDGDGQNDPADIMGLYAMLISENAAPLLAMVSGERRNRKDTPAKKWASRAANGLRRRLLNDGAVDTGCGLKVFYRDAYLRLPYFDHMHRYLPALMQREGFDIAFLPVSHRARVHGTSKYTNFGRFMVAIRDLMGVSWLMGRANSPKTITEERD